MRTRFRPPRSTSRRHLPLVIPVLVAALVAGCQHEARPDDEPGAPAPSVHDPDARERLRAAATPHDELTGASDAESVLAPELAASLEAVRTEPGDVPRLELTYDGERVPLPLEHTHFDVNAVGPVADVEVRQTYRNPFREPIETVYVFPLPENSAVIDLRMVIGERVIEADMQRRAEARHTYETARREGHTAALLEQERPNVFTQSVANIAPESTIEVVVRYAQDLTWDNGEHELVLPMVVGPRYHPGQPIPPHDETGTGTKADTTSVPDASRISPPVVGRGARSGQDVSVDVTVDMGRTVGAWAVPTHAEAVTGRVADDGTLAVALASGESLPNRDFVMRWTTTEAMPQATLLTHEQDGEGYFSLVVQPPELDVDALVGDRELIFVVDVSGSMSGVPLAMAKRTMELALRQIRPSDTFDVITFAGRTARLWGTAQPASAENIRAALQFLDGLQAGGGTELREAVDEALDADVAEGRHRHVLFMTDGFVSNEAEILDATSTYVRKMLDEGQRARVFGIGMGSSVNRCLLNGLAAQGRGISYVTTTREDPAVAVNRVFGLIDAPVLTNIEIDWGDLPVSDVEPAVLPDLFASRPLAVHGRYQGASPGRRRSEASGAGRTSRSRSMSL